MTLILMPNRDLIIQLFKTFPGPAPCTGATMLLTNGLCASCRLWNVLTTWN